MSSRSCCCEQSLLRLVKLWISGIADSLCLWHIGWGADLFFSCQSQSGMLRLSGFGSQRQPTESCGSKPMDKDLSANTDNQNPSRTAYQKIRVPSALSASCQKHRKVRGNPRCFKFLICIHLYCYTMYFCGLA